MSATMFNSEKAIILFQPSNSAFKILFIYLFLSPVTNFKRDTSERARKEVS